MKELFKKIMSKKRESIDMQTGKRIEYVRVSDIEQIFNMKHDPF